jgi:hypothetical protein
MLYNENGVKIKILELAANTLTTPERRPSEAKYIFVLAGVVSIEREHNSSFKLCKHESMLVPPRNWHGYKTYTEPVKVLEIVYGE